MMILDYYSLLLVASLGLLSRLSIAMTEDVIETYLCAVIRKIKIFY